MLHSKQLTYDHKTEAASGEIIGVDTVDVLSQRDIAHSPGERVKIQDQFPCVFECLFKMKWKKEKKKSMC